MLDKKNIVVIGASSGGLEPIRQLITGLPADLDAALFVVWHMGPDALGVLPELINKLEKVKAVEARKKEYIEFNRIYVAPPDRHLIIEDGFVRATRGPKEHRFRPAIDPLFRSAAQVYGPRVIGIVLSGALDDGTAGLWAIKEMGGTSIVQDPADAEFPSMPQRALDFTEVDYCLPVPEIIPLLIRLTAESAGPVIPNHIQGKTSLEVRPLSGLTRMEEKLLELGTPTVYTCPECHGVLSAIRDGRFTRYRCHMGHAFSADSLLTSISENIEATIWSAVRAIDESILLLNQLGDHSAEVNDPKLAAVYFRKANEAERKGHLLRQAITDPEQLSFEDVQTHAQDAGGGKTGK